MINTFKNENDHLPEKVIMDQFKTTVLLKSNSAIYTMQAETSKEEFKLEDVKIS